MAFSCKGIVLVRVFVKASTSTNTIHDPGGLPVHQWVLSFPKRLRYFVQRDAALAGRVLGGFLRAVEAQLRVSSPGAPADARFGGVTFVQRFGAALNPHLHFHAYWQSGGDRSGI